MIVQRRHTGLVIGLVAAIAVTVTSWDGATAAPAGEMRVQGRWTYTQRPDHGAVEHMATTPSAEDSDTWLLVACSGDERLTVAVIHASRFAYSMNSASRVTLRSGKLHDLSAQAKTINANQIVIDPGVMRQVMPLLTQEDRLVISISEQSGRPHDYTFLMQPNDIALASIRSRCFRPETDA